ncbi:hypothetical protein [Aeromonas veronii]|uniref:hypothetical protein n=1 Tax=Aeromonas veronii TaxID=654 RepID=UPI001F0B6B8D|nr:hypothetical protein [Aeromonas veronii]
MKRGHELMADHAKELAKQKLRELAETVQTDAAAPGDGKVKHVDAGERSAAHGRTMRGGR